MSYIVTRTGKLFYPLAPTVEKVDVVDIVSALSKMTRWTGHTISDDVYSVAQHAFMVSFLCDPEFALDGLHHDSSEAYLVDVARPVKYAAGFMDVYLAAEAKLTGVIYEAFGIPFSGAHHPSVVEADDRMLATEARDIMPVPETGEQAWGFDLKTAYDLRIDAMWSPRVARENFIARHNQLMKQRRVKEFAT